MRRRNTALLLLALVALYAGGSPRASAAPVVTSTDASASASCQSAITLFNPVLHFKRDDAAGPPGSHVTDYDTDLKTHAADPGGPSVTGAGNINEPNVVIGGLKSDSHVKQTTKVTAGADTVSVESSATASVEKTRVVTNCCFGTVGSANAEFSVDVVLAQPCRYQVNGSVSGLAAADGFARASISLTGDGAGASASAPANGTSVSISKSGVFQPGAVALRVSLFVDLGSVGQTGFKGSAGSTGSASWVVSLTISPDKPPGGDVRWTKSSGGTFGADANWNPKHVPVKDLTHTDNAIFDIAGSYTVDFAAAKTKALGPPQHTNRLEILRGDVTEQNANITVDELELTRPSLTVDAAKLTLASGHLTSNSARIGALHAFDATVVVDGPDSLWNCLGQLRIGGADTNDSTSGNLTITNGADVTSVDTQIGAGGGQQGFASIRGTGSTWNTDNVQVGFSGIGTLEIKDGAVVTSALGRVGGLFKGNLPSSVVVEGVDAGGKSSEWDAQALVLLQDSLVFVNGGARIVASTTTVNTGGVLTIDGFDQARGRPSTLGCTFLAVGNGSLELSGGGEIDVVDDVRVGFSSPAGRIVVGGEDAATHTASLLHVDGTIEIGISNSGANVQLRGGGRIDCGNLQLGTESGAAGVALIESPSLWAVGGDVKIGGSAQDVPPSTGLLVFNGGILSALGGFLVRETGSIQGHGVIAAPTVQNFGSIGPAVIPLTSGPSKKAGPAVRPPNTLTIQGNLVVEATGVVRVDAGGPESDHVVVTGDATLGGTLLLQFMGGYAPKAGEHFDVVQVGGQTTGDFATVDVRGLAPGAQFTTAVNGGTRTMTTVADTSPLPTVSVKTSAKSLSEKKAKKKATLTFSRKGGSTAAPLTVSYAVGGTATNGIDYVELPGQLTIPARKRSAKVAVQLVDDPFPEPQETIGVAVLSGDGYTESLAPAVQIAVVDNDSKRVRATRSTSR